MTTPPTVSVLLPTCRPDGLALVCRALEAQTFRDFELVIADEVVDRIIPPTSFPVRRVHVRAHGDWWAPVHTFNAGLVAARGRLVAFLHDQAFPSPTWLASHLWYHGEGPAFSAGPTVYHPMPADLPVDDVAEADFVRFPATSDFRCRAGFVVTSLVGVFDSQNSMCPRDALLALNGFDESLDDTRFSLLMMDADLVARLYLARVAFVFDRDIVLRRVAHRDGKPKGAHHEVEEERRFYGDWLRQIHRESRTVAPNKPTLHERLAAGASS